ncbi:hypothetical protein [Citrobacter sp. 50677481]|nr:hypothetical protein [Citrobacter sp. 50677481]
MSFFDGFLPFLASFLNELFGGGDKNLSVRGKFLNFSEISNKKS